MYTKYEVDGANRFEENFQKPRKCTDGRTEGCKDRGMEGRTLRGDQDENRVPLRCSTGRDTMNKFIGKRKALCTHVHLCNYMHACVGVQAYKPTWVKGWYMDDDNTVRWGRGRYCLSVTVVALFEFPGHTAYTVVPLLDLISQHTAHLCIQLR